MRGNKLLRLNVRQRRLFPLWAFLAHLKLRARKSFRASFAWSEMGKPTICAEPFDMIVLCLFVCLLVCLFGCFESRSGYKDRPLGRFSPSPWRSVFVTGRLTNSPTLHLYTGHTHRVIWPVRKENDQRCRSGNRTRVTQLELTLIRAPYPLDQRSFLVSSDKWLLKWGKEVVLTCSKFVAWSKYVTWMLVDCGVCDLSLVINSNNLSHQRVFWAAELKNENWLKQTVNAIFWDWNLNHMAIILIHKLCMCARIDI